MYLVEEIRLASPTQLAALQRRKALFRTLEMRAARLNEPAAVPFVAKVEIVEEPPVVEPIVVRKYQAGLAADVVKAACVVCGEKYRVEPRDILGRYRTAQIVKARHACIYVLRNITLWSLPEIGRRIGGRDHTTVLHALRKFERLKNDVDAMATLSSLKERTIEELKAGGVEIAVSPFGEQYVPEQQQGRQRENLVPRGQDVEDRGIMDDQISEAAEV